jgi:2,4-dienoyl-CoA reductase-like NADH-dependent reductase (Old Yellow Enzyme family)/thioredoxin reductase
MTSSPFPRLFSPIDLRGTRLKNRICLAAHGTGMAEGGTLGNAVLAYYEARVRNGVGLVVSEAHHVVPIPGQTYPNGCAATDDCIEPLRRLVELCEAYDCRFFGQLYHEGRARMNSLDGSRDVAIAPSALPDERFHIVPREMTVPMIEEMVADFASAAGRMARAGVHGVEVLVGMGYLHAQFLSPRTNHRTDGYGGTPEGRRRFLRETLLAIREAVGDEPVVGFRIVPEDTDPDGLRLDESVEACRAIADEGLCDYISVTLGGTHSLAGASLIVPSMFTAVGASLPASRAIRGAVSVPVLACGRINQPQDAERALEDGDADVIAMARAFIADPEFAAKAADGRADEIRACIACNQACIGHRPGGHPVSCIQHPETGRELEFGTRTPTAVPKDVVVVGGGPGGMKAAAIAAERGHRVTLYERASHLGGQALLARSLPGRAEFGGIVTNLEREVRSAGVDVRTGVEATARLLLEAAPDAIVVATGARPHRPDPEWFEGAHVVTAWDVILGEAEPGPNVVVADWGCDWVGPGVAEMLRVEHRCKVRLCVNGEAMGQSLQSYVRHELAGRLHREGVEVLPYLRLRGADADTVYLQHVMSGEPVLLEGVDTLVLAYGHRSETALQRELDGRVAELHAVGDCLSPRTAEEAVLEGLRVGTLL